MTKLHELLACEKTRIAQANKLLEDTQRKFAREQYFQGHVRTLSMLADSPENQAIEAAARDEKALPTTVAETLQYALQFWAQAEDVIFAKNVTNQSANADLLYKGQVLVPNVPVDELLGLENRLETLRKILAETPTLDASKEWSPSSSGRIGEYSADKAEVVSKTEKVTTPVILYEATDKHPAQVKEVSVDKVVGTFTKKNISGAATSKQKADAIAIVDELLVETKQARQRANSVEASTLTIGSTITNLILTAFA